jgi:hypothetical protein
VSVSQVVEVDKPVPGGEEHPIWHKWYLKGDIVTERRGRTPIVIQRHYRCEYCYTERIDTINVSLWEPVRKPRYVYYRGETIVRMTKRTYLRMSFLATTDLDPDTKKRIERVQA